MAQLYALAPQSSSSLLVAVHLPRLEGVLEYNVSAPKASASGPEAQTSQTPSLTAFKFLKAQTGCKVPNRHFA